MSKETESFLEAHRQAPNQIEFWSEHFRTIFINHVESTFNPDVINEWGISDIIPNGDKFLIKWYKRIIPKK